MAEARTRRRGGGGAARRAERTAVKIECAKFITRNIPNLEILNEEALEIIEYNAETVLEIPKGSICLAVIPERSATCLDRF